jgi:hypothetical protein
MKETTLNFEKAVKTALDLSKNEFKRFNQIEDSYRKFHHPNVDCLNLHYDPLLAINIYNIKGTEGELYKPHTKDAPSRQFVLSGAIRVLMFKENHADSADGVPVFKYRIEDELASHDKQTSITTISDEEVLAGESFLLPQDTIYTTIVARDSVILSFEYCQQNDETFLYSISPVIDLNNLSYMIDRDLCNKWTHDDFNEEMDQVHCLLEQLNVSTTERRVKFSNEPGTT